MKKFSTSVLLKYRASRLVSPVVSNRIRDYIRNEFVNISESFDASGARLCLEFPQFYSHSSKVTAFLKNPMDINFRILVWYGKVQKAQARKMFTKKVIMSPKPVSLPPAIIRSASSPRSILLRKRILLPSTTLPFLPWKEDVSCLEKPPLLWTEDMTITRCSLSWMNLNRTISSALPLKESFSSTTNGFLLHSCVTKGKIKTPVCYKGKEREAYLVSHVKVQITASRKDIYLVLVYGLTEHPMMLATNKPIKSKEDVIHIARTYFSRWKIEEYFRCKKQVFQFENFRVRKLKDINALNFYITLCMAFLAHMSMKSESHALKVSIIQTAAPIKEKVNFCYYRLAKGIAGILSYAKEGIRLWFRTKRPAYRQICLKLVA